MNTWFTRTVAGVSVLASLSLAACNKDETRVTLTPSNAPTLTASASSVTLLQTTGTQQALTVTWSPVKSLDLSQTDGKSNASVVYYLQVDQKGHNFSTPGSIALGTPATSGTTTTPIKVSDLNTALTRAGLPVATPTDAEMRVSATYAPNGATYSSVVPLNASIYECKQPAAANAWSLIGPAGKDWNNDVILTYDCSTSSFTYTGPLKADAFKFRYGGAWTTNLGGASSTGGVLMQNGPDMKIATAGTYTIELKPTVDASGNASGSYTIKQ